MTLILTGGKVTAVPVLVDVGGVGNGVVGLAALPMGAGLVAAGARTGLLGTFPAGFWGGLETVGRGAFVLGLVLVVPRGEAICSSRQTGLVSSACPGIAITGISCNLR